MQSETLCRNQQAPVAAASACGRHRSKKYTWMTGQGYRSTFAVATAGAPNVRQLVLVVATTQLITHALALVLTDGQTDKLRSAAARGYAPAAPTSTTT